MLKTDQSPTAYDEVVIALYQLVKQTSDADQDKLRDYLDIARLLFRDGEVFRGTALDSYAMNLYLWIELRLDTPEMADAFERTILDTWPILRSCRDEERDR